MPPLNDLTGQRYGKLLVTALEPRRRYPNGRSAVIWKCRCDCGNALLVHVINLRSGHTRSCGCIRTSAHTALKSLYTSYRSRAKHAHRMFSIPLSAFEEMTSSPCFYCGDAPQHKQKYYTKTGEIRNSYPYNGLDRKDSSLGYTLENCVPACKPCNTAKLAMTQQQFYAWVSKVYHFSAAKLKNGNGGGK